MSQAGQKASALELLDGRIAQGGEDLTALYLAKAEVLARAGEKTAAIDVVDKALTDKPDSPALLNSRCWTAATLNIQLDAALRDCTRAIELGERNTSAALDSRAMVYYRLGRLDDALADLKLALVQRPGSIGSLFLRGVINKQTGRTVDAEHDLADARLLAPQIDAIYARYGIKP